MKYFLGMCMLGASLLVPVAVRADDDQHHRDEKRYYDRDAKDWHQWNDKEDRAYHQYLGERHAPDHEWVKANKKEQREYFRWRHTHPDVVVVDPDRH